MRKVITISVIAGIFLLALLSSSPIMAATAVSASMDDILNQGAQLVISFEGFSATPYWDVTRWSWGYGTAAPGSTGTITKAAALAATQAIVQQSYWDLQPQITRNLNANQWAALLSFDYNEGEGNADNLVNDINAGDDSVLEPHWKEYIYAGGVVNQKLVDRRNKEWALWAS